MEKLTIKELNKDCFQSHYFDTYDLDLGEMFNTIKNPTQLENQIIDRIIKELKIDGDTQIIEFRATATILITFLLNVNRKISDIKLESE